MSEYVNISSEFWQHIEEKRAKSKKIELIYRWLDQDNLGAIIVDGNVFWTELTHSTATMPAYVFQYIKKWAKERGLTYLYDVPNQQVWDKLL